MTNDYFCLIFESLLINKLKPQPMKRLIAWGMFVMIIISFAMPVHASFAANDYTTVSINAPPGDQILIVVDNFAIIEQSYLIQPEPEKQMYAAARSSPIQETFINEKNFHQNLYNKLITQSN